MDLKGNTIAVVVSDKNGKVVFGKLKAGSYQLQETRAPEGYAVVSEKLKITIKAGQSLEYDFRNILLEELDGNKVPLGWIDVDKPDMPDKKHNGTKLPQAGTFFDTNMLLIFGMGFVALGSVLLVSRRRNKRNEA
ncbi:MAG: surface protein [Eubacterium sp.]|nr:surface protein [Eubacterium sp.]